MQSQKEEFMDMLSAYQGILHKVNLVYFRNASDREDNFQEIVYQLWRSYPNLRNKESIGSWIYAVSINTSISRIKREKRLEYRGEAPELTDSTDIENELAKNESVQFLLNAISHLDEINKSVILLYLDGMSYKEIAEIIGISESNAGVRINRSRSLLKKTLKEQGYEE